MVSSDKTVENTTPTEALIESPLYSLQSMTVMAAQGMAKVSVLMPMITLSLKSSTENT